MDMDVWRAACSQIEKIATDKLAISPELRRAAAEKRQAQLSGLLALKHKTTGELADYNEGTPATAARLRRQVDNFKRPSAFSLKSPEPVASTHARGEEFARQKALHTVHMPGGAAAGKAPAGTVLNPDLYNPTAPRRGLLRRWGPTALVAGGAGVAAGMYLRRNQEE